MRLLDDLPLASIVALVSIVLVVIGYLGDDLSLEDALTSLGAVLGGTGVVGLARAASGKGVRKDY